MSADLRDRLPDDASELGFEDELAVAGTLAGAFLVLAGLGTVLGAPWTTKGNLLVAAVQVLGALATAGVGAGLVWLVQS